MAWQERRAGPARLAQPEGAADRRAQRQALVRLASRLLVAQAAASAAIGLAYSRRNASSLLLTILVAVVLCGLACLVRSGGPMAWLGAVSLEVCLVAAGLVRFVYDRYLGGTLLAIITLGTLLHPAVARAFAAARWRQPVRDRRGVAEGPSDVLRGGAAR
jgi:hypothetical protein